MEKYSSLSLFGYLDVLFLTHKVCFIYETLSFGLFRNGVISTNVAASVTIIAPGIIKLILKFL